VQVESLRQLGDAAGTQLSVTQARLEQLTADKEEGERQLSAVQASAAGCDLAHSGTPAKWQAYKHCCR
jgi:hypothetical protein